MTAEPLPRVLAVFLSGRSLCSCSLSAWQLRWYTRRAWRRFSTRFR